MQVRGSYSTAFRAPTALEQFGGLNPQSLVPLPGGFFPGPGGTFPIVLVVCCSTPLQPEESENYTLGATYTPNWARGARFDLTYYSIDFTNRIVSPPFDPTALLRPGVYGSLITPFASDAEAQAHINALTAQGYVFNDLFGVGMTGIEFAFDQRQQNAAFVEQEGIDVGLAQDFDIGADYLTARLNLSYITEISTAPTATSEPIDVVNTYGNPLRFRARADLSWEHGPFTFAGAANYWNAYDDTSVLPTGEADAWTTVDLNLMARPAAVKGLSIGLSVINAFDEDPPFVGGVNLSGVSGVHYDTANADPVGRFVSLTVRKQW